MSWLRVAIAAIVLSNCYGGESRPPVNNLPDSLATALESRVVALLHAGHRGDSAAVAAMTTDSLARSWVQETRRFEPALLQVTAEDLSVRVADWIGQGADSIALIYEFRHRGKKESFNIIVVLREGQWLIGQIEMLSRM